MNCEYHIKTLSPALVLSLKAELLSDSFRFEGDYWDLEHFLIDLPQKWNLSFITYYNGVLAGYAILSFKPPGHIHRLVVRTWYRSIGLGARMVAESERRAGLPLTLKVSTENRRAQKFYISNGFGVYGGSGEFLLMRKD